MTGHVSVAAEARAVATDRRLQWRDRCGAMIRRSQGVLSIADQVVLSGTNFATSVLIGRTLGKEMLGVYALALTVALFARGWQQQVVFAPYMVYCHRRRGLSLCAYTGSAFVHNLVLALLMGAGLLAMVGASWLGWGPAELLPALGAMLAIGFFFLLRDFARQESLARLQLPTVLAIDAVVALVQIGGIALLCWTSRLTVAGAVLMMGLGCTISSIGWFLAHRREIRIVRRRIVPDWRHNWRFARWALASHLVGSTAPIALPWLLTFSHGAEATGLFSACSTIIGLAWVIVGGLTNLAAPRASRAFADGGLRRLRTTLFETMAMLGAPALLFVLLATFAGDRLAELLYGGEYVGCGPIVVTLGCWMLANTVGITTGSGLWALERPSANLRADVVQLLVTLAVAAALVPPFGVWGAALGMCLGTASGAAVRSLTLVLLLRNWETEGAR